MYCRNTLNSMRVASKLLSRQQLLLVSSNDLYSAAALGVNGYEYSRQKFKQQFQNLETKFKEKMVQFANPEASSATIFTEDLKHMVHLAEEQDLPLVLDMMSKFAMQNKELRFGSYVFGPVVMRMYHFLNKPEAALQAFREPSLNGFFDQLMSFQILMDLLLKNERYDEVLEVFEAVTDKQLQGAKYPKNVVVLAFAACYKKNTKDAFEFAKNLWSELNSVGHYPMRRAATFAAALAVRQGEPAVAIEILTTVRKQSYVTVRNLKVSALADLGRPDDALPVLRNVLEFHDSADPRGHTFLRETMDKMEAALKKLNNQELTDEFNAIASKLDDFNLIQNTPLDEQLCSEIDLVQTREKDSQQYNRRPNTNRRFGGPRPGVMNLV